jgi:UDP-2,4-diacetamido-2,4,6-trideoxy-beta-L-altropyranose hydrolase
MRCLALAQAWHNLGGRCIFITATQMPMLDRLVEEGFDVRQVNAYPDPADVTHTKRIIAENPGAWLILDGYQFDAAYQKVLHETGVKLLVIDDAGHLPAYYADLILNQNLDAKEVQYSAPGATKLLGTHFALLRREFGQWQGWQRTIPARARKVLVTMGGADPDNVTLKVIRALGRVKGGGWEAIVLIGAANPHQASLDGVSAECGFPVRIERAVRDVPSLMAWADLALTAAGSTCWELCFMGLPSILVQLAANQTNLARTLQEFGAAINAGWHADLQAADLAEHLWKLADDSDRRSSMARAGRVLVDGHGARRVVEAIRLGRATVSVRRAGHDDCRPIWEWANDPAARAASFSSGPISWERHVAWYAKKLSDPACYLYVVTDAQERPVGMVRYDVEASEAVVSINIAPAQRGRGLGPVVLRTTARKLFAESDVQRIVALVKPENRVSVAAFERAGYDLLDESTVEGPNAFRLVLSRKERRE